MLLRCFSIALLLAAVPAQAATAGVFAANMPHWARSDDSAVAEAHDYVRDVLRRITANQNYPKEALHRAWEGAAQVDMVVGPNGRVKSARLLRSTGHAALDQEALAKVRLLESLPLPPRMLRGREFSLAVPVVFRLEP